MLISKQLAENILSLLEIRGVTQTAFADALDESRQGVNGRLRSQANVKTSWVDRSAVALKTVPWVLLGPSDAIGPGLDEPPLIRRWNSMKNFQANLRSTLSEHKIEQAALGRRIGKDRQVIYELFKLKQAKIEKLDKIAKAVGLSLWQLILPEPQFRDHISTAKLTSSLNDECQSDSEGMVSFVEGKPHQRFVVRYERDLELRSLVLEKFGLDCMACGFNFGATYGEYGEGYIHVHHKVPVSEGEQVRTPSKSDFDVLCANCHSIVHRKREQTLTLDELKRIIVKSKP